LKMKAELSFETSGSVYPPTQRLVLEERNPELHRCRFSVLTSLRIKRHAMMFQTTVLCSPRQRYANSGRQITRAPNNFGSEIWKLLHITYVQTRILRCLIEFWKIFAPLGTGIESCSMCCLWFS
jgi:hypothetical protein